MEKKIKEITITQNDYIIRNVTDDALDIQVHLNHFSEFDQAGNLSKEIKYNRHGEFEEMYEYAYNEKGQLISESFYPLENELAELNKFERNESGMIIRSFKHYQDSSIDTTTYLYDESNQLIQKTTTSDEGEVEQVESFEWDNGAMVRHEIVDGDGDPIDLPDEGPAPAHAAQITRNDKDQVIHEEELDEHGEVYMTINRSYDDDGRPEEVEVFIDGRGRTISRHYFLKYSYTFFD